jgi:hypothetical protein
VPNIDEVVHKWTDEYLLAMMEEDKAINTLVSKDNHFMYWTGKKEDSNNYKNPVDHIKMSFKTWLRLATDAEKHKLPTDSKHYYFRKNEPSSQGGVKFKKSTFIGKDISIFSTPTDNFFVSDVSKNKGIQCRFGMRGKLGFIVILFCSTTVPYFQWYIT